MLKLVISLLLCVGIVAADQCLYDDYGLFINANNRWMQVNYVGDTVTVIIQDFAVHQLLFKEKTLNDPCVYDKDAPNGWTVVYLSNDNCQQRLSKTFSSADYQQYCASYTPTETGAALQTTVEDITDPLLTGYMPDGSPRFTTVDEWMAHRLYVPTTVSGTFSGVVINSPPAYNALVNGTSGAIGTNAFANFEVMINAPYKIYKMEPVPIQIPDNQDASVILPTGSNTPAHTWRSVYGLLTSTPKNSNCYCSGHFQVLCHVNCDENDDACDVDILTQYPTIIADFVVYVDKCPVTSGQVDAELTILTKDANDQIDVVFTQGDLMKIEEIITLSASLQPPKSCSCITDFVKLDWLGNIISEYPDVQNDPRFSPALVDVKPLYNNFTVILPSELFDNKNGDVIEIQAVCAINWNVRTTYVRFAKRVSANPSNVNTKYGVALNYVDDGGDSSTSWVWILVGCGVGVAAMAAAGAAVFVIRKRNMRSSEGASLLQ